MSVKTTYTCDNCGAVKGETNHWFAIHQMATGFLGFSIIAFADSGLGAWHLCGEACVMAKVSQCLREISAAAVEVAAVEAAAVEAAAVEVASND